MSIISPIYVNAVIAGVVLAIIVFAALASSTFEIAFWQWLFRYLHVRERR